MSENNLDIRAEDYSRQHGEDAYQKVGEAVSMAVGNLEWDNAYDLQRVQWRVRKLDRLRQVAAQLGQRLVEA